MWVKVRVRVRVMVMVMVWVRVPALQQARQPAEQPAPNWQCRLARWPAVLRLHRQMQPVSLQWRASPAIGHRPGRRASRAA